MLPFVRIIALPTLPAPAAESFRADDGSLRVAHGWLRVAKESFHVAKKSLLVAKESFHVAKKSLLVAKESSLVAKESWLVAKKPFRVAKKLLRVAGEWFRVAQKSSGAGLPFPVHHPRTRFPVAFDGIGQFANRLLPGSEEAKEISRGQAAGAAPGTNRLWSPPRRGGGSLINRSFRRPFRTLTLRRPLPGAAPLGRSCPRLISAVPPGRLPGCPPRA